MWYRASISFSGSGSTCGSVFGFGETDLLQPGAPRRPTKPTESASVTMTLRHIVINYASWSSFVHCCRGASVIAFRRSMPAGQHLAGGGVFDLGQPVVRVVDLAEL